MTKSHSPHHLFLFLLLSFSIKPNIEKFEISKNYHGGYGGYEEMEDGDKIGDGPGGGIPYDDDRPDSPASFEEIERPPLRKIDKYCKAECPCLPARYTIAVMACVGFMISFGMRCNMSAAKLKGEQNHVSVLNLVFGFLDHPNTCTVRNIVHILYILHIHMLQLMISPFTRQNS